jgi:hypothetical protein
MSEVIFHRGYSSYRNVIITDTELSDLVGLETYKALYEIAPKLYLDISHPMIGNSSIVGEVRTLMSRQDGITARDIKADLVKEKVNSRNPNYKSSGIIAGLVRSSPPRKILPMSPQVQTNWLVIMAVVVSLLVAIFIFWIWPLIIRCPGYIAYLDSSIAWINTPWI